ncbi:S-layer homology domain-containing protein [Candidatus Peregrinibacteria bacterium]|nr:S-layer homology domain-containing protein [Candidatus Peregrinibacteria bacterium]
MKYQLKTILIVMSFLVLPLQALALSAPHVESYTMNKAGTVATLKVITEKGAKITVVGGPTDLPPVTDTEGKGVVEVQVGVVANEKNNYSITAQVGAEISNAAVYVIDTVPQAGGSANQPAPSATGDVTPPVAPKLDSVPSLYYGDSIRITGSSEGLANIYVRNSDGKVIGSAQANEIGIFGVTVPLEIRKTNRLNISAEDTAGNEGAPGSVTIRVPGPVAPTNGSATAETVKSAPDTATPFDDLRKHWAQSYVEKLYKAEVVNGKAARQFDPNGLITRAELVKIALKAFGYPIDVAQTRTSFRDVRSDDWFAPYVYLASKEGIVSGMNGYFKPNQPVTRAAALKILLKAASVNLGAGLVTFKDVPRDAWYMPYVAYAKKNFIVSGYDDDTFHPENPITRAEAAKMVVKTQELKVKK